ncbi:DNA-processing protein DprA [Caenibacillus caldisaponilyticus]|uniref:DNA-processing protein DprA n=1 Tax=Caenibacillus caldisaponilyticus TaxID=1674942 RepID=UPI000988631D|nr:DNA-processing protein DprA [Caenibacillus caldisaponilyticus]
MSVQERLFHVHLCRGIGRRGIRRLLRQDPDLERLYDLTERDLILDFRLRADQAEQFLRDLRTVDPCAKKAFYGKQGIQTLTFFDDDYPLPFKHIPDPPWVLYVMGHPEYLRSEPMLAVVGTRHPSEDGLKSMERILKPLVAEGWTIVSGLAVGVDGFAHRLALASKTVAVLGSGLNHPYPRQNLWLFDKIKAEHVIISEYPPETPPARHRFPERNRLISGLAFGTLVVEAREKSGSLITADQALEQGREVFALPGSILNPNAAGTNALIQQGAKLVRTAQDIREEWAARRIAGEST